MSKFKLIFPENEKRNADLSETRRLNYDALGAYKEEREKVARAVDKDLETDLRIDYSDFSNHICFDSAASKFSIAKDKVLTKYPFNGTLEEKEAYILSGTGYDEYVFNQWPRYVGYANLDGTDQYISASDVNNALLLSTSSLYVSAWIKPTISEQNMILQLMSSSAGPILKQGYEFYLSGATDPHVKFSIYSGSEVVSVSASYTAHTASFNNVAVIYDQPADILSLYINANKQVSSSVGFGSLEYTPSVLTIGSGSQFTAASSSYEYFSGALDEIRIAHTASHLFHLKNYSRPINADDYLKVHYKLNESITETGSIDQVIVDYSKNGLHGKYLNYDSSRTSGSVMYNDYGDPILYSFHSDVISFTSSIEVSASLFDNLNNNFIYNMIPSDLLIEDDNTEGLLSSFTLGMARYFDEIKAYIDQLDNLRITNYQGVNETPDQFLYYAMKYFGLEATSHFLDAEPLAFYFGEDILSTGSMNTPLVEVKNQFWRRMLNNLPYIVQSKGKKASVDAFLNVLGIGKENIKFKEFGYTQEGTLDDTRIFNEKPVPLMGIGTGSFGVLSSSFIKASDLITESYSSYTVETTMQLPYFSASYSGSLLTGSIWQCVDPEEVTGSFTLLWVRDSLTSTDGKFMLTSSDGQSFETSSETLFDGDIAYIAAGLDASSQPFIELRTVDGDEIDFSASYSGDTAFSGVFTGSNFDFIMGANSGSTYYAYETQGFYGEYRYWSRNLSASEMDAHANHYASIGIYDPQESPNPLLGHWALDENKVADADGVVTTVTDYSRNGNTGTGREFPGGENPYQKFLLQYNYLSPSLDLKWTENKVRIRNKSELKFQDVAKDTNEVAVEFNLVDALNEDISKIFSSFDVINNTVGAPINKYRDEYIELEDLRKVYFARLEDSVNFTNFFKLFEWFDKKLADAIKQLLPARVKFVGAEQVVESHFLERPKFGYKYDLFLNRPKHYVMEGPATFGSNDDGNVQVVAGVALNNPRTSLPDTVSDNMPAVNMASEDMLGTAAREEYDKRSQLRRNNNVLLQVTDAQTPAILKGDVSVETVSSFADGQEIDIKISRGLDHIHFHKYSGDEKETINDPNTSVNNKNLVARKTLEGIHKAPLANKEVGNLYRFKLLDASKGNEHYFYGHPHYVSEEFTGAMNAAWYDANDSFVGPSGSKIPAKTYYAVTTGGVKELKEIGNADVKILYVNRKVARNVED